MNYFSTKNQSSLNASSKRKICYRQSSSGSLSTSLSSRTISAPVLLDPTEVGSDAHTTSSKPVERQYNDNAKLITEPPRTTRSVSAAFSIDSVSSRTSSQNPESDPSPSSGKKLSKIFSFKSSTKSSTKKLKNRSSVYLNNTKFMFSEGSSRNNSCIDLSSFSNTNVIKPILQLAPVQFKPSYQINQDKSNSNSADSSTNPCTADINTKEKDIVMKTDSVNKPYRLSLELSPIDRISFSDISTAESRILESRKITKNVSIKENPATKLDLVPEVVKLQTISSESDLPVDDLARCQDLETDSYKRTQRTSNASTQSTHSSESVFTLASKFSSTDSAYEDTARSESRATSIFSFTNIDKDYLDNRRSSEKEEDIKELEEGNDQNTGDEAEESHPDITPEGDAISQSTLVLPSSRKPAFDSNTHCYISQALPGVLWVGDMYASDSPHGRQNNCSNEKNKSSQYFDNNYLTVFLDDDDTSSIMSGFGKPEVDLFRSQTLNQNGLVH
ncbi:hypothetical protein NADFUDRAFT_42646 [Nadsonia fulvescens var. elongata DSM 6958]|uniref:Uncharacterized protein n=1 Tax=Nadsonia fulvescens var. elongata DSM 6958 TaxID=857566 RepID=A0A1E3PKI8_9ASCO|nr:hypothetical protein NADFUDRAFT_42646 [Nadsonia fulvescens var. elongata DSM 6958]